MHKRTNVAELLCESWSGWFREIEDERLSGTESIREQLAVGGHVVFDVMRAISAARHRKRRYQRAVVIVRGAIAHVVYSKKVGPGTVG